MNLKAKIMADLQNSMLRLRAFLPADYQIEFDAGLSYIRQGHYDWAMLRQSLSSAQWHTLVRLQYGDGFAVQIAANGPYYAREPNTGRGWRVRSATVRALVRHGLLICTGTITSAEEAVCLSEKGHALFAALRGIN